MKRLKDEVKAPSDFDGALFDPSWMLYRFLKLESYQTICGALGLPLLDHDRSILDGHLITVLSEGLIGGHPTGREDGSPQSPFTADVCVGSR